VLAISQKIERYVSPAVIEIPWLGFIMKEANVRGSRLIGRQRGSLISIQLVRLRATALIEFKGVKGPV